MAQMIPSRYAAEYSSPGEKHLFDAFATRTPDEWIVLHALDIAPHADGRRRGEADFVAIVPGKGVAVLEVKSVAEQVEDGTWFYGPNAQPSARSPFEQAAGAMYAILKYERRELGARLAFHASGAITPFGDIRSTRTGASCIEWNEWQSIGESTLAQLGLARAVVRLIEREASETGRTCGDFDHARLAELLRPRFEFFQSPRARQARRDEEIRRYTTEQYDVLDEFEANGQLLVDGPAGTGKTMLAIEAARRAAADGLTSRIICYNTHLGDWLAEQLPDLAPAVKTNTLHGWLAEVTNSGRSTATAPYHPSDPPEFALACILDSPEEHVVDVLIVDEAQDVIIAEYLDCLSAGLKNELSGGSWLFLGDLAKQDVSLRHNGAAHDVLQSAAGGRVFRRPLRKNCRNTHTIAEFAQRVGRLEEDMRYTHILRPDVGAAPEAVTVDHDTRAQALAQLLDRLLDEGFRPTEIVALSMCGVETSTAELLREQAVKSEALRPWADRLRRYHREDATHVRYDTVRRFKGLEAPVIVLTDFAEENLVGANPAHLVDELLYVGASRALDRVYVLCDAGLRDAHGL